MINLTPEEREVGRDNYYSAVTAHDKVSRRDFLVRSIAAGGITAAGVGAMYFGYQRPNRPIRVCVIGTGDEGSVLMGAINPDYVQVTAICDIRPSSQHRAFHGDWSTDNTIKVRPGLMNVYNWKSEDEARRNVKVYSDWKEAVLDPNVDGVIIATPLFLHAEIAVGAMKAGKHVLCEKLMAHNIAQCKLMARTADETGTFLSVGHQRHYSILYDNAVNLIRWGLLGEIHHIRAQWHRNNVPGKDSWALAVPGGEITDAGKRKDKIQDQLQAFMNRYDDPASSPKERLKLAKQIVQWQQLVLDKNVDAEKYGYINRDDVYADGRTRTALEEMVRWRLWDRTGGGLMAELGSHQLDAASIFISALSRKTGHHVHPLTVHAVGGRHVFPRDRDADDHVYCSFEFPGQGYDYNFDVGYKDTVNDYPSSSGVPSFDENNNKKIVVTYSSINGNGFGGYGEVVLGTKGTLVLDREKEVMLYPLAGTSYKARVKKKGSAAVLDTSASGDAAPAKTAEGNGPVSRGYREEIEHWAWCISTGDLRNQPRCNGSVALADAVIALTAKQAMANAKISGNNGFMQFQPGWFDVASNEIPEVTGKPAQDKFFDTERKNLGLS
jgi:predicted dehydrogenase|tara:strand:+ start:180 stop:2006 length:1827 start_codon:yes stop_codon:yes gene_type:complete